MQLFHGSRNIVEHPQFDFGNPYNDFGLGFYCTESENLAREWASPDEKGGYVNSYSLDIKNLSVIDLEQAPYNVLHWIAILVANRKIDKTTPLMDKAERFLQNNYSINLKGIDVIFGYRADDSYFSFARAFLDNRISVRQLEHALKFGNLGRQVVIKSKQAFDALKFVSANQVDGVEWFPKRCKRDKQARKQYKDLLESEFLAEDIFILDILRGTKYDG